jgi:hypothetical protein
VSWFYRCSTSRLERGQFSRLPSPCNWGGGRGLLVLVSVWGFTVSVSLWAFVFSGYYGRRPHYVQVGHMTGRERRDGPPLMVYFIYVLLCIVFVVLWTHGGSVFN